MTIMLALALFAAVTILAFRLRRRVPWAHRHRIN